MDTTDFLLLWFGSVCLGAALFAIICEPAPVMDWDDSEERRTVKAPLTHGGVIHPTPKAAVPILPCRLRPASWCEVVAWRASDTVAYIPENDALVAETIADLWRTLPPQDIYVEDD